MPQDAHTNYSNVSRVNSIANALGATHVDNNLNYPPITQQLPQQMINGNNGQDFYQGQMPYINQQQYLQQHQVQPQFQPNTMDNEMLRNYMSTLNQLPNQNQVDPSVIASYLQQQQPSMYQNPNLMNQQGMMQGGGAMPKNNPFFFRR